MIQRNPYSAQKGAELMQAKRLVLHRFATSEEEWLQLMIETGCRFAEHFCRHFNNKQEMIDAILKEKPKSEESSNFYWVWWRSKWMMDDEAFIKSKLYYEALLNYQDLKTAMIGDRLLENQLLQTMYSKQYF